MPDRPSPTRGGPGTPLWRRGRRRLRTVRETSAGGIAVDRLDAPRRAVVLGRIDRRGRLEWVLPKGHVEPGETHEQAAVREVREETGLIARVAAPLRPVDYRFTARDRRIHKTVHHFLLEVVGGTLGTRDVEVQELAWVPIDELPARLRFEPERRLVALLPDVLRTVAASGPVAGDPTGDASADRAGDPP